MTDEELKALVAENSMAIPPGPTARSEVDRQIEGREAPKNSSITVFREPATRRPY